MDEMEEKVYNSPEKSFCVQVNSIFTMTEITENLQDQEEGKLVGVIKRARAYGLAPIQRIVKLSD